LPVVFSSAGCFSVAEFLNWCDMSVMESDFTQPQPDPAPSADATKGSRLLQLFARHDRALRAYARVILTSLDDVDDVMQEVSLVIWEKHGQLRHEDEFLPWAKVIVRNVSFRYRRKQVRDRHVFDDTLVERLLTEEEEDARRQGDRSGREYRALMHCLDQLPFERRELLLAPYRGAGAVKQLAEDQSRSANSLYKLLQRLRSKLLDCVENQLSEAARA